MRSHRVFVLALTFVVLVVAHPATDTWAQSPEQWRCSLDLHQGNTGVLELSRTGTRISGVMIIVAGQRRDETTISGQWNGDEIGFTRVLSATSQQPFRGRVSAAAANRATMSGQFAAGFAGAWSAACERTQAAAPPAATTDLRRRQPAPVTTGRDARIVTQIEPLITRFNETPGVLLDLLAKAPTAKWSDSSTILQFPGDPANSHGSARYLDNAVLEDGQAHGRVLGVRPAAHRRAIIVGRYASVTIPQGGAELRAGVGFLKDAVVPDGIFFEVRGEFDSYHGLRLRREYLKPRDGHVISDFTQDLSRFRGLTGTVVLSVAVGDRDSAQPGAAWLAPQLAVVEGGQRFASFVGGAVGSGRNGSQLQNAWGEFLYGDVALVLVFADVDRSYPVQIESYFGDQRVGTTTLPAIQRGQTELWTTLHRTDKGSWRERVIFNGTYVGDLRYQISRM